MPFIGKNPTSGFSTIVKDDLTPDGSTTAFTLSKNVASANDIAVFVGNVRQEPTDAYSVSGTTLTMTAAPASGLNFYVLHIAGTLESSVVPAAGTTVPGAFGASGQLSGGSGSFTGNVAITSGDSPLTLTNTTGSGYQQLGFNVGTQSGRIVFTGESFGDANYGTGDLTIQTQSSGGKIRFGTGAASTNKMIIDSDGYVTKPNQVSFFAGWATTSSPPSGYGAVNYGTGFSRVGWNVGSGWDSAGTFTAPVTGKYLMYLSMGFTSGAYNMHLGFYINGGGGTTAQGNSNGDPWQQTGRGNDGSSDQDHVMVSRIFNLNANDTLKPVYLIFDNDNNSQVYQNRSFVGGYLLG